MVTQARSMSRNGKAKVSVSSDAIPLICNVYALDLKKGEDADGFLLKLKYKDGTKIWVRMHKHESIPSDGAIRDLRFIPKLNPSDVLGVQACLMFEHESNKFCVRNQKPFDESTVFD